LAIDPGFQRIGRMPGVGSREISIWRAGRSATRVVLAMVPMGVVGFGLQKDGRWRSRRRPTLRRSTETAGRFIKVVSRQIKSPA